MTKEEKNKDTKQSIINVANELFAKNGFAATSVREIAQKADVNLSAVNYHFQSKENLYWSVFDNNHQWMNNAITEVGEKCSSTEELAVETLRFFMKASSALQNCFKIFLNDNIKPPSDLACLDDENFGPPGQAVFVEQIRQDVGDSVSDEDVLWVMRMIFSLVVHHGIIMNTSMLEEKAKSHPEYRLENIEKQIAKSVTAHLKFLEK